MQSITQEVKANIPKRPANAFMLFRKEVFNEVKGRFEKFNMKRISKVISKMWVELTSDKRKKYSDMHQKAQEEYKEQGDEINKYENESTSVNKTEKKQKTSKLPDSAVSEKSVKTTNEKTLSKKEIKQKKIQDKKSTESKKPKKLTSNKRDKHH